MHLWQAQNWGAGKKMNKGLILWPCPDLEHRNPTNFPSRHVLGLWPSCLSQPLDISGLWISMVHLPLTHHCSGLWVFLSSGLRSLRSLLANCLSASAWYKGVSLVTLGQTAQTHYQETEGAQHFTWRGNWNHGLWMLSCNQIQGKNLSKNVLFSSLGFDTYLSIYSFIIF